MPSLPAAAGVERHLEHALLNLVLNATEALQSRGGRRHPDHGPGRRRPDRDRRRRQRTRDAARPGWQALQSPVTTKTDAPSRRMRACLVAREVLRLSGATLTYAPGSPSAGARFVITLPLWRREPAPRATQ